MRRRTNFVFILSLSFLAYGCRTLQTPDAPFSLSVDNSNAAKKEADQAKTFAQNFANQKQIEKKQANRVKIADPAWESIQKQRNKSAKNFNLTELIDLALKNNPQTRSIWEGARVAGAVERQAESALYPQLTVSASITREKILSDISTSTSSGKTNDYNYGPSAQLTYLILDFGGRSANIESTFQKVLEANSLYDQALQDLILNVQTTYYDYYSAQSAVVAAEMDVENTKTDYDAAQQRFDVGLVPKLDVLQAKSNYENSLYNLENSRGSLKTAKANLAQAIGVSADTNFDIIEPAKELKIGLNEDDISVLIEEAIRKRPNILALKAELKSQEAASRSAFSDLLPTLNLGLNAQVDRYRYYNTGGLKDNKRDYSGVLSIDWNIFDGFSNWNKKKQADYEVNIALDNLIQAEIEASSDVWVKYYDFDTAVRKLEFSRSFYDTSAMSYDLALESYKTGLKSILDLLQAQANLSQARSRLIQSKQDVFIALAQLAHSTGTPNIKIDSTRKSLQPKGDNNG